MNLQEGVAPNSEESDEIKEDLNKEVEKAIESGTELVEKSNKENIEIVNKILQGKIEESDSILKSLNSINNSIKEDILDYIDNNKNISEDVKCIEAYFTPGRKPRKRDLNQENIVLAARGEYSEYEIRQKVKATVESHGFKYKDKWCKLVYVSNKALLKNVVNNSGTIHIEKEL